MLCTSACLSAAVVEDHSLVGEEREEGREGGKERRRICMYTYMYVSKQPSLLQPPSHLLTLSHLHSYLFSNYLPPSLLCNVPLPLVAGGDLTLLAVALSDIWGETEGGERESERESQRQRVRERDIT